VYSLKPEYLGSLYLEYYSLESRHAVPFLNIQPRRYYTPLFLISHTESKRRKQNPQSKCMSTLLSPHDGFPLPLKLPSGLTLHHVRVYESHAVPSTARMRSPLVLPPVQIWKISTFAFPVPELVAPTHSPTNIAVLIRESRGMVVSKRLSERVSVYVCTVGFWKDLNGAVRLTPGKTRGDLRLHM
jgi:hypothetical protein